MSPGGSERRASKSRKATRSKSSSPALVPGSDPIRHVIWLILENRSFDHMLGCIPGVDGVLPPSSKERWNKDPDGRRYYQEPTNSRRIKPDPKHETPHVLAQLEGGNKGFVADYARAYPETTTEQRQEIMGYHPLGNLKALHTLAQSFAVFDRWFASVPGPTWANRLFALSGTSKGRVKMPNSPFHLNLHDYDQVTIFDLLSEKHRTWAVYYDDFPLALLFKSLRTSQGAKHMFEMGRFYRDVRGPEKRFAEFAFIEPDYLWPDANDDHPPHDPSRGQRLLANVYAAIRANEELWNSSLFIVSYDEHGGFYDHVPPPPAVPPDTHKEEYTFDLYGVRVPAVLASPWIDPQVITAPAAGPHFDHTSVLRYLQTKWSLGGLGRRTKSAANFEKVLLARKTPRKDTPKELIPKARRAAAAPKPPPAPERVSELQSAIVGLSQLMEQEVPEPAEVKNRRAEQSLRGGPRSQFRVVKERTKDFLRKKKRDKRK